MQAEQATTGSHDATIAKADALWATTITRLWEELAAMTGRARQHCWHLQLDGSAQDLEAAEQLLRATENVARQASGQADQGSANGVS